MNTKKSEQQVIADFFSDGGKSMVIIGTDLETSKKAINLANKYEHIYATIGIHPCDIENLDLIQTVKELEKLYVENKQKIVAIGEIGLDYYRIEKDAEKLFSPSYHPRVGHEDLLNRKNTYIEKRKELQALFFRAQTLLAKTYDLPFIIHNREAGENILQILKQENYTNFILHSYSENLDFAKKVLEFAPNTFFGFSGVVTFKNATNIQETAKYIPEQNILAETDSPFLTPTPFRGKEENEPKFTKYVIEKISSLRGKDMNKIIVENSKRAFGI